MRMDAEDAALGIENATPRTIEGPLYVAGAPESVGYARMDDGSDPNGHTLILHGTIFDADGKPLPNAKVEIWHANTKGFYSHFDPTGEQQAFNMRRSIITDENGQYRVRTILPAGYGCPPEGPTQQLLNQLGRHGNRPAHIHYFVSADGHRKLTTQINVVAIRTPMTTLLMQPVKAWLLMQWNTPILKPLRPMMLKAHSLKWFSI